MIFILRCTETFCFFLSEVFLFFFSPPFSLPVLFSLHIQMLNHNQTKSALRLFFFNLLVVFVLVCFTSFLSLHTLTLLFNIYLISYLNTRTESTFCFLKIIFLVLLFSLYTQLWTVLFYIYIFLSFFFSPLRTQILTLKFSLYLFVCLYVCLFFI